MDPFNRNKKGALTGVAKSFGKDVVKNLLPGVMGK
jgi:hypothetical protein